MTQQPCPGPMTRRHFLEVGGLALGGIGLADVLAARAEAGQTNRDTSVILLYLHGGPSQLETYDLKPEMNAAEVTDMLIAALEKKQHDYVICNLANPDMVGHTGVLEAAIRAVETVDSCVGRILDALDLSQDVAIVTSDHGNAEMVVDPETGGPHTAHTTNPVPCILVDKHYDGELISNGSLRDIAPTICNYLGVPVPEEMTGRDLRSRSD